MTWGRWAAGRLASSMVTLAVLAAIVFTATDVLPGDAVGALAGPDATVAERADLRVRLGLDRPLPERFGSWITGAAHGDLGRTAAGDRPVAEVIGARLPASMLLAMVATAFGAALSLPIGLASGMGASGRLDRGLSGLTALLVGIPEFLLATVLLFLLTGWLHVLPPVSLVAPGTAVWRTPSVLVLPTLALGLTATALASRLLRSAVADVCTRPYVRAARLAGIGPWRLAVHHVLPNAIGPWIQALTLVGAGTIGGAVVVEALLGLPGIGGELVQAVRHRDVPLVQGIALALGAVTLVLHLAGDLLSRALDPRGTEASA